MLRLQDRPPDFILPDNAGGGHLALADLIGRFRLLIALASTQDESDGLQRFIDLCARRAPELNTRDLVVLVVVGPDVTLHVPQEASNIHLLTDAVGQTMRQYDGSNECPCFYLIGKDGEIKYAQEEAVQLDDILGLIDTMPMRRNELARRAAAAG